MPIALGVLFLSPWLGPRSATYLNIWKWAELGQVE